MMDVMVDLCYASYPVSPAAVTLDIDETVNVVHGGQQLSFWNGHIRTFGADPARTSGSAQLRTFAEPIAFPECSRLHSRWEQMLMTTRAYLLISTGVFIAAVTGSDLIARMTIAGNPLGVAITEYLYWASLTIVGIVFLFAPFVGVAVICGAANRRAKTRGAIALFFIAMAVLVYFYFGGFQASQQALLDSKWTAAALSIGLRPFFIGLPLSGVTAVVASVLARVDPRETVGA